MPHNPHLTLDKKTSIIISYNIRRIEGIQRSPVEATKFTQSIEAPLGQTGRDTIVRRRVGGGIGRPTSIDNIAGTRDAEVFTEGLVAKYGEDLFHFVLRLTGGDHGRAEDIVQETMLRAWRHHRKLIDTDQNLKPWLSTVARRLTIDKHRKDEARGAEIYLGERHNDETILPQSEDFFSSSNDAIVIRQALMKLSEQHREVLTLLTYGGFTVEEIARRLDMPLDTAKSRVFYAMRSLRKVMEGKDPYEKRGRRKVLSDVAK